MVGTLIGVLVGAKAEPCTTGTEGAMRLPGEDADAAIRLSVGVS